jgi:hypothetical protein
MIDHALLMELMLKFGPSALSGLTGIMKSLPSGKSNDELKKVATIVLFKEWDDRLGPSRLWLLRRNPNWARAGFAREPMKFEKENPAADDAESAFHANRILNFIEDVAIARGALGALDDELEKDLYPAIDLWYDRCEPLRTLVKRDSDRSPWEKADKLVPIVREWRKRQASTA